MKSLLKILVILPCLLLTSIAARAITDDQPQKQLVIINSYNDGAPWSQQLISQIMTHISTLDVVIQTDVINLNNLLIHDAEQYDRMAEGVFSSYKPDSPPEYAILLGNMAFSLRDRIESKWGKIPMILIGQDDVYGPQDFYYTYKEGEFPYKPKDLLPLAPLQKKYNFTLVYIPNLYRETIDMMLFMFPHMKKIAFIADEVYLNHLLNAEILQYLASAHPDIEYEWVDDLVYNSNGNNYLYNNDFNTGILLSTCFHERTSVFGDPMLVSDEVTMICGSRRPVFSLRSAYLQLGATGGYYPSPRQVLENIKEAVNKMLSGENMGSVPFFYTSESYPIINYPKLKKEGLSEKICPPGTHFLDEPESFWSRYRFAIVGCALLLIALFALGIGYTSFQRKKIRMLNDRRLLLSTMPIGYTEAIIYMTDSDEVERVEYRNTNDEFLRLAGDTNFSNESRKAFYEHTILPVIRPMLETGKPVRISHYFNDCDRYHEIIIAKSFTPLPKKTKATAIHLFSVDVTDKSKAENELRDFARKLDVTLNVARIIPWRWNLLTGKISCEIQRMMHHSEDDQALKNNQQYITIVDEKDYFANIFPEDMEKIRAKYEQLISGKTQYVKVEYRTTVMKRGTPHQEWVEVNASINSRDEDGRPTGIIGSMLFITQRKLQEEQLIKTSAQAQESDRLKSAFLANMSHEIRTPLNAIVGFSNLLTKTPDHAKRDKFISIIENNNELLLQLISDVLDLSKIESNSLDFKIEPTDINDLLTSVEATIRLRLQPGVALNLLPGANELTLTTDRKRLTQVVTNMLNNACKFTSKGNITFGYEMRDDHVYFFVKDTGIGISQEDLPKLYNRFVKLDTFVQGTGLGLSISKHIVEKLGGRVGVESDGKGKGSKFWFTIPLDDAADKEKDESTEDTLSKKNKLKRDELTILIAEDNKSNYMLFQSILEKDYRLIHAWDGSEAVKLFDQFRPSLVLMDINMPVMDGYEATRQIRKLSPKVPIIAVTAYAYSSDRDKILSNGFDGYLAKPVSHEKLSTEIKNMIANHFMLV